MKFDFHIFFCRVVKNIKILMNATVLNTQFTSLFKIKTYNFMASAFHQLSLQTCYQISRFFKVLYNTVKNG